jgi:intracellular sulfur oxidation DsrE/DsrF family protein
MKRNVLIAIILFMAAAGSHAQTPPYHAVFDLTTGDTATHQRVVRWVKSILASHPDARLEVVFYGKSLPMVEKEKSTVSADIEKLAEGKRVVFAVCEQAMKVFKVDKSELLQGVRTVPDAIYEIISLQSQGYGYIKVTN